MISLIKKVYQCETEKRMVQIVNALIWAVVMIATAWLMRGSEQADTVFLILLMGASTTLVLINDLQCKAQCEDDL
jgi:hypothetical protein